MPRRTTAPRTPPAAKQRRPSTTRGFERLKALPNFEEIHQHLASGLSVDYVARRLQSDLGLCTDISFETLRRQLFRYRETIPVTERQPRKIKLLEERAREYAENVNVLQDLTQLYQFQRWRVDEAIERYGDGSPEVGKEMDRAAGYLERIADLKHRLGLFQRGSSAPEIATAANVDQGRLGPAVQMVIDKHGPNAPAILAEVGRKLHQRILPLLQEHERQKMLSAQLTRVDISQPVEVPSATSHEVSRTHTEEEEPTPHRAKESDAIQHRDVPN